MKKPAVVKIVEVLGWAYVALAAFAGLRVAYDVIHFGCPALAVLASVLLILLAMPLGMVLSLRYGRRVWFLCFHCTVLALFLFTAISFAVVSMSPKAWVVAGMAIVLLVAPIVLLLRPESSLWFRHVSGGEGPGGGCLVTVLTLLWFFLIGQFTAEMSYRIQLAVSQASHEQACVAEQDADDAELPPDDGEAPPGMDANYGAREGAVYKVLWWLKATQQEDGSWNDGPCPVAATALGICAFLAHGEFPYSPSPYAKDFTGTVIAASEYVMGCVSETNGVLRIRGGEDDERSLPIVTMALCELYGMTRNPDAKENAVLCLRHLVSRAHSGLASGEWQGKDELLLWTAEALLAAKWSMSKVEALSEEEKSCQKELRAKVFELTSRLNDNGYCGGRRRYLAWMSADATKKDDEEYRDWMIGKKAAFVKALKEDQEKITDTKGILHSKGFLSESIDAKPSGFGVSADSALGVMALMIGGGGFRNLPPTTMPSGFRPPDHSSLTNNDAGVSVDI